MEQLGCGAQDIFEFFPPKAGSVFRPNLWSLATHQSLHIPV